MASKFPDQVGFALRMPPDVKTFIERESARSYASQNAEIVKSIRERMQREKAEARSLRATERA
jgi:hypothetical protein